MWEWMLEQLHRICKETGVSSYSGTEEDDVVSEVCLYLLQNPKYARMIYEENKTGLLLKLVKTQIYDSKSKLYFDNKTDFSNYRKIETVCEKYGIEMIPQNAYKIYGMMKQSTLSIQTIASLIEKVKPQKDFYGDFGC